MLQRYWIRCGPSPWLPACHCSTSCVRYRQFSRTTSPATLSNAESGAGAPAFSWLRSCDRPECAIGKYGSSTPSRACQPRRRSMGQRPQPGLITGRVPNTLIIVAYRSRECSEVQQSLDWPLTLSLSKGGLTKRYLRIAIASGRLQFCVSPATGNRACDAVCEICTNRWWGEGVRYFRRLMNDVGLGVCLARATRTVRQD